MKSFVLVSLSEGSERRIVNELKSYNQIKNIHILFGEWDLMAEIEVAEAEELGTFIMDKIRARPDVKLTSSLIVAGQ